MYTDLNKFEMARQNAKSNNEEEINAVEDVDNTGNDNVTNNANAADVFQNITDIEIES